VLRSFSWTLFIGIIIGTYSSIYIAAPFMLMWEGFRAKRKAPASAQVAAPKPAVNLGGVQLGNPAPTSVGVTSTIAGTKRKKSKKR